MATDELHYLELTELTRRIHAGELTSAEATEASLARIAALDGTLRSYALEQARTADGQVRGGRIKGPLHGAPIAVKDLCWIQGGPDRGRAMLRPAGVGHRRLDPLPRRHAG